MRLFALTSIEGIPSATEIHEYLKDPARLASDLIPPLNSAMELLDWGTEYSGSADIPDPAGLIQVLIVRSLKLAEEDGFDRKTVEAFSNLMIRVISKATDGKVLLFKKIMSEASISIGHDVLLKAVAEQGKWRKHPEEEEPPAKQFISDGAAVDQAILDWCSRVQLAVNADVLHHEAKLHPILFRWSQLSRAPLLAIQGVKKVCSTSQGLMAFAKPFAQHGSHFIEDFELVWNGNDLASLIESDKALTEDYSTVCTQLRSEQVVKYLAARDTALGGTGKS
jgi:hypothetical protein